MMEVRDSGEMKRDSGVGVGVGVRVWGASVRVWVRQTRERICVSKARGGKGWGDKGRDSETDVGTACGLGRG
jgi:hypothetical protein